MTFDFSAILLLLTLICGLIWGAYAWFMAPRREAAGAADAEGGGAPLLVEYARSFFPVFLIVLLLRSFLVEPFRIPSASMMPTLLVGDFILVNKYTYGIRLPVINRKVIGNTTPRRGDVVVFRYPEDPSVPFIKRVIGIPGDRIVYRNRVLYINGQQVEQDPVGPYQGSSAGLGMDQAIREQEHLSGVEHAILIDPRRPSFDVETVIPPHEYFVMGDNRDNSRDSRFWGFVPDRNLIGRAFLIWMHLDLKNGGVDWSRIGTIIK